MILKKLWAAVLLVVGLAACSPDEFAARQAPAALEVTRSYTPVAMTFSALPDLTVSEAEVFYPIADIVWRGDPRGPRIAQIGDMFETAFDRAKPTLQGTQRVVVNIELVRFHGLTNRTRYSVGGLYNVVFNLTVRDAVTGAVIETPRRIAVNLDGPGGETAVALEQSGQTQKVRMVNFLASTLRSELS